MPMVGGGRHRLRRELSKEQDAADEAAALAPRKSRSERAAPRRRDEALLLAQREEAAEAERAATQQRAARSTESEEAARKSRMRVQALLRAGLHQMRVSEVRHGAPSPLTDHLVCVRAQVDSLVERLNEQGGVVAKRSVTMEWVKGLKQRDEALVSMQAWVRGYRARKWYQAMLGSVILVQRIWRGYLARKAYKKLRRVKTAMAAVNLVRSSSSIARGEALASYT